MAQKEMVDRINNWKRKQLVLDYIKLVVGTLLMGLAISSFFEPHNLVTGGVTGIGIIIKAVSGRLFGYEIPLYISNFCINIPLIILGLCILGWRFMARTFAGTLLLTFFLYIFKDISIPGDDILLHAFFGGLICGAGMGLVFSASATTGGSDTIASIVQHYAKHISVAWMLFIVDTSIMLIGIFVFDLQMAMYAIIAVYLTSKVADQVIEGFHFSKAVYIISQYWEEIAEQIMYKMERGVTGLKGEGMYSHQAQQVLFCIISSKELIQLKAIIYSIDPKAFVVVSEANEVLGEGFLKYNKE